MGSIAMAVFLDSEFGAITELQSAGSALEHPLVFDSAAREIQALAVQGKAEILQKRVSEFDGELLIDRLHFRRLM